MDRRPRLTTFLQGNEPLGVTGRAADPEETVLKPGVAQKGPRKLLLCLTERIVPPRWFHHSPGILPLLWHDKLRARLGGFRQSGVGRNGATSSVVYFTELKRRRSRFIRHYSRSSACPCKGGVCRARRWRARGPWRVAFRAGRLSRGGGSMCYTPPANPWCLQMAKLPCGERRQTDKRALSP